MKRNRISLFLNKSQIFFGTVLFALSLMIAPSISLAAMEDYPSVKLRALDKSTARTSTIEVQVGKTYQFGSLFIKPQACRKSGPLEKPETTSFLQIWEVPIHAKKSEWIFSGWMFSSSPALSAMDHSVYDVWVLDCAGKEQPTKQENSVSVTIDGVPAPETTKVESNEVQVDSDSEEVIDAGTQETAPSKKKNDMDPEEVNDLNSVDTHPPITN